MDHPSNPLSTWHVVRNIHMLNPCIVAESPVTIGFVVPLYLRYRLVAHDVAVGVHPRGGALMSRCDDVHAFADGELAPDEAERFRTHLADCARCQAELHDILGTIAGDDTLMLISRDPVGGQALADHLLRLAQNGH